MLCGIITGNRIRTIGLAALVAMLSPMCLADDRLRAPDPGDPKAAVPSIAYQSSFDRFTRFEPVKPIPWRSANDTVRSLGGHMGSLEKGPPDAKEEPGTAPSTPAQEEGPAKRQ
jgi:hypothetical protein